MPSAATFKSVLQDPPKVHTNIYQLVIETSTSNSFLWIRERGNIAATKRQLRQIFRINVQVSDLSIYFMYYEIRESHWWKKLSWAFTHSTPETTSIDCERQKAFTGTATKKKKNRETTTWLHRSMSSDSGSPNRESSQITNCLLAKIGIHFAVVLVWVRAVLVDL